MATGRLPHPTGGNIRLRVFYWFKDRGHTMGSTPQEARILVDGETYSIHVGNLQKACVDPKRPKYPVPKHYDFRLHTNGDRKGDTLATRHILVFAGEPGRPFYGVDHAKEKIKTVTVTSPSECKPPIEFIGYLGDVNVR